ncbi:MAG: DUF3829 domain-containing protein [Veillonella sp.]|uniref:DUF3829 domain-containing protein n=1 Tax=Veillonella sp. TaxID=1926307 RepID=UPI001D8F83A1|nr:DUF3829 domain-containing protein [Veillonella sp.]MBS7015304.1 DUF3829 domain-containing protein [Veillonella sp.]
MKPLVKKMLTAVLCASTLTAPLFLTGCSVSKVANGVQKGVQKAQEQDVKVFNNYIEAVSDFNDRALTFDFAHTPTIQGLKSGQHLTSFSSPDFKELREDLQKAKTKGVPYDDMKGPLDKVLAVLDQIVPVANELKSYYEAKTYTTDNYAKEQQLGPKYVQLYEQFYAVYPTLNDIIHKHNIENQQEQLKALKDAGKKNAAAAQEAHLRLTAVLDNFEGGKPIDVNAVNQELQAISDVANSVNSKEYEHTKKSLNKTIGAIRTFMAAQNTENYNDMIEEYNDLIGDMNNLDVNKLDK